MSRYSLNSIDEVSKIDVGYDAQLDSYYLQVRRPNAHGEFHLTQWKGSGVGGVGAGGIVPLADLIIDEAARVAVIPEGLLEALLADRDAEPEVETSVAVLYAGYPDQTVWRYRSGVDSERGLQLPIKNSKVFHRSISIAMVLLREFLGNEERAKKLAKDFAASVVARFPTRKPWMLTEVDMQQAIASIESNLGLSWVVAGKCYVGEGQRVQPEEQLRRTRRKGKRDTASPQATSRLVKAAVQNEVVAR